MDALLAKLDPDQLQAATHPLGHPAVLVAGAGSGKTSTLTARAKWCIEQGIPERRVCVITFTNKAANELRTRLGFAPDAGPRISTIHSLSLQAIRKNPGGFGLRPQITPMDTHDQVTMMQQLIKNHAKDKAFDEIKAFPVLEKLQYHRARGLGFAQEYTPEVHERCKDIHSGAHQLTPQELTLWADYQEAKSFASCLDFDDMLHLVVRRGQDDSKFRDSMGRAFDTVLLDESQDSNKPQWDFIELLFGEGRKNLFCCGDISQSIYAWNGASPETLLKIIQGWRGLVPTLYKLENNYRSLQSIVGAANRIQATMQGTVPLTMRVARPDASEGNPGRTTALSGATPRDIAEGIAQTIARDNRLKASSYRFRDNAILVRAASQIPDIEAALATCRIPYIVRGGQSLLQTEEAKDLFSYMKLLANPRDAPAFVRAIGLSRCGVGPAAVEKVRQIADKKFQGDMIQAACDYDHRAIQPFGQILRDLGQLQDPALIFSKVIKLADYRNVLMTRYARKNPDLYDRKLNNLVSLETLITDMALASPSATCADIIFRVTLDASVESEKAEGVVVISTIHAMKGLEAPRVYVMGLYEGSLPSRFCRSEAEIEEELRVFYVACTRAETQLVLCVPHVIMRGPNAVRVNPSRFLAALGMVVDE